MTANNSPVLIEAPRKQSLMMDRGLFDLMHVWDLGDGDRYEYWRGMEMNGAVCRFVCRDYTTCKHFKSPGDALRELQAAKYPVPGLSAYREELTPAGPQLVIPGCERVAPSNSKPFQPSLLA